MKTAFAILAILATALPLTATAGHGCTDATATAVGTYYLGADLTLWQESNNHAGLQRTTCEDDNGRNVVKDTQLL